MRICIYIYMYIASIYIANLVNEGQTIKGLTMINNWILCYSLFRCFGYVMRF
jgi:hypothetical protein